MIHARIFFRRLISLSFFCFDVENNALVEFFCFTQHRLYSIPVVTVDRSQIVNAEVFKIVGTVKEILEPLFYLGDKSDHRLSDEGQA